MLRNYLLSTWRNIQKHKLHTAINIFGLAIGIAACLVIFLMVRHEFSYDRHHPGRDRIYRITSKIEIGGSEWVNNGGVSAPMPAAVREDFSGLETVAGFHTVYSVSVKTSNGQDFGEKESVVIAGPDYFQVFSGYHWLVGDPTMALAEPYRVVLTEHQAHTYFGEQNPLGQTLIYFDSLQFIVSGILADNPHNTDLAYTDFLSYATLAVNQKLADNHGLEKWQNTNSSSLAFVKLAKGTSPADIERQFPALIEKYIAHDTKDKFDFKRQFRLQPLDNLHFDEGFSLNHQRIAHKPTLYGLIAIGLFLLLIACINFINLETARAGLRAQEVGVRKVLGSSRQQLMEQFLGETLLLTALAGFFALALAQWTMDYFAESLPPGLSLNILITSGEWLFLLGLVILVSLLSGIYPALILSSYSPASALKNQIFAHQSTSRKAYLRKSLIVFQFAISQTFILGTLIVSNQIHYLLSKDMGFQRDAIVHFRAPNVWQDTTNRRFILADELKNISGIDVLSLSNALPANQGYSSTYTTFQTDSAVVELSLYRKMADTAFLDVYGIELLAGRKLQVSDTLKEVLLNETAIRKLGFAHPAEAIGHLVKISGEEEIPIVGVVRDFHDGPLREPIHPVMLGADKNSYAYFNLRLPMQGKNAANFQKIIQEVEQKFKQFYPEAPFEYAFYDDTIAEFYHSERRTSKTINAATILAVFISCLGLFGLVSFTTNQRTKEIGIRKVLGATAASLLVLFSKEFVWIILTAFVIAVPFAWYFTKDWLENFAYRVPVGPGVFVLTAIIGLTIALLTIGFRAWRAALANPVDSLKNE